MTIRKVQSVDERTHIPIPRELKAILDGMQEPSERSWETYSRVIRAGISAVQQDTAIAA